jgi:hypothetical protein
VRVMRLVKLPRSLKSVSFLLKGFAAAKDPL